MCFNRLDSLRIRQAAALESPRHSRLGHTVEAEGSQTSRSTDNGIGSHVSENAVQVSTGTEYQRWEFEDKVTASASAATGTGAFADAEPFGGALLGAEWLAKSMPGGDLGEPVKTNQDAVTASVVDKRAGIVFAGVFDGHGEHGHVVSQRVASDMLTNLQAHAGWNGGRGIAETGGKSTLDQAFIDACNATNDGLADLGYRKVDLRVSGTTAVMALLDLAAQRVMVANVGDSRAFLCRSAPGGKIMWSPLSHDHSPSREDECARIESNGGIITPIVIDGEQIGPPRIWRQDPARPGEAGGGPGLCMTRSFGDLEGAEIGLHCEPEMCVAGIRTHDLRSSSGSEVQGAQPGEAAPPSTSGDLTGKPTDDLLLVLASDGLFEYHATEDVAGTIVDAFCTEGGGQGGLKRAATIALENARSAWVSDKGEIIDDCTILIARIYPQSGKTGKKAAKARAAE